MNRFWMPFIFMPVKPKIFKIICKTMSKKSFFLGLVTGVVLTFVGLFVVGLVNQNTADDDPVQYFEQPVNYENKKSTSFKVFQVLGNAALASEISNMQYKWYNGTTVLLLNGQFYCDQVIELENPKQVGTYNYQTKEREVLGTTIGGNMKTVPVIDVNQ